MMNPRLTLVILAGVGLSLTGCKHSVMPVAHSKVKPVPVAYQQKPIWLSKLEQSGIKHHRHRQHDEFKIPVETYLKQDNIDMAKLKVALKPMAEQLKQNHYQVAEINAFVLRKKLDANEKQQVIDYIDTVVNTLRDLNVDPKIIVKSPPRRISRRQQNQKQSGTYIAVNLYQTHQGHGLVY